MFQGQINSKVDYTELISVQSWLLFPGCLFFMASVHSTQFMEFAEVENHDNSYSGEDEYIHTQDQ